MSGGTDDAEEPGASGPGDEVSSADPEDGEPSRPAPMVPEVPDIPVEVEAVATHVSPDTDTAVPATGTPDVSYGAAVPEPRGAHRRGVDSPDCDADASTARREEGWSQGSEHLLGVGDTDGYEDEDSGNYTELLIALGVLALLVIGAVAVLAL